jgi:hypothetical protein
MSEANAVTWCAREPRPTTARLISFDKKINANFNGGLIIQYSTYVPLPKHVWCEARDEYGRKGPCFSLGTGECLQGWVRRRAFLHQGGLQLNIDNEHSQDARYITLWDDLKPADQWPREYHTW